MRHSICGRSMLMLVILVGMGDLMYCVEESMTFPPPAKEYKYYYTLYIYI